MVEDAVKRLGDWTGRVAMVLSIGIESYFLGHHTALLGIGVILGDHDAPRDTHNRGARRHIFNHHRIGAHTCVITDGDWPKDLGARTHHDVLAERRMALGLFPAGSAQCHTMIQRAVIADFAISATPLPIPLVL